MDKVGTSQLRHNVPGTSPLNRREKISRYLESSVGHGGQHEVSTARAEEDSDSGNSLFLTQVGVTLPVARGSAGRHPHHTTSNPTDLTESEDDLFLSCSSDGQRRRRRRKKHSRPIYHFPFLKNHKRRLGRTEYDDLHNCMIGGLFKCLGELRQRCQGEQTLDSCLPTVDQDGEHISPLSEEDGERSEDENIKVVERKYFVSLSTKKSKRNWCNQLKKQDQGKSTNTGKKTQTEMCSNNQIKTSVSKDIQMSSGPESSDNGISPCNVLDQKGRKAKNATGDGNLLATTGAEKNYGCLGPGDGNVSFQQKASEEGQKMCNANDAGVLRSRKSLGQAAQKGREASEPVTIQEGDGPGDRHLLHGHPDRISVTTGKKTKKYGATSVTLEAEETPGLSGGCKAAQTSEVPGMNGENGIEDCSRDGNTLRQGEGDISDSKQKRKKKKKSLVERVEQEVDGTVQSEVRVEKDGKKKRRKGSGKKVELLQPSADAQPPNDSAEIQKEKKKDLPIVMTEEHEAELNRTLDLPALSTEQKGESGNCLENVATSHRTSRLSFVKRKKDKKKQQSFSNDAPDQRKEGVDQCRYLDDSVTMATGSRATPKKERTILEETNDYFYTKKKKKKKEKSEIVCGDKNEDTLAQTNDSASTRKKEKKKSSFLVADSEENNVQTHSELVALSLPGGGGPEELEVRASDHEELNNGVADQKKKKKKKKKRTLSVVQDSVEKDHEENGQEPDKTRRKRKKCVGSESEGLDCAADTGFPPLDEASGLKKRNKKKRCYDVIEDPPTAKDGSTHDKATTEALTSVECDLASSETPGKTLETRNLKKKKCKTDRGETAELERRENKKQKRDEKSTVIETSDIFKNMHGKLRRKLYNPNGEFFTG